MTALNLIQRPGVFHMFGDTAMYGTTATLTGFEPKIHSLVTARSVIGFSGRIGLGRFVVQCVLGARSIHEVVEHAERAVQFYLQNEGCGDLSQTILLAGFADDGEQQAWEMKFRAADGPAPKFARLPSTRWAFSPAIQFKAKTEDVEKDIAGFCRWVLNEQRKTERTIEGWNNGRPGRTVGGAGIIVTVKPNVIGETVVERWPDVVGVPVTLAEQLASMGINTGASSNYDVNSSEGFVAPTLGVGALFGDSAASYTATKGTGAGTLSSIFQSTVGTWAAGTAGVPSRVSFDLGSGVTSNCSQVILQWHYAGTKTGTIDYSDDGTEWTTAGSFNLSAMVDTDHTVTVNEPTAHRYWSVNLTAYAGSTVTTFYKAQFYAGATDNMTLVTAAQTTDASVSKAQVLIEFENTDEPTLGTDITIEVMCDGGSNWTTATPTLVTAHSQGGRSVVETNLATCTAGTSVMARVKVLNGKNVKVHALALSWE